MRPYPFSPRPSAIALAIAAVLGGLAAPEGAQAEATLSPTEVRALSAPAAPAGYAVDTERLSRALANDLQSIFTTEPSVASGTGTRNGQKIFLRGIEDLNLNVQIDGARQGANLFHHQSRLLVDPFLLKQVTVNPGPAEADAGPGALGGSVRFETVDAQDLLRPGQQQGARLGAQAESADHLRGGVAAAYGLLDGKLGLLAYSRRQLNEDVRVGGGGKLPSTEGNRGSQLLKLSVLEQDGHSLWASLEQQHNTGGYLRANFPWQTNNAVQALDDQRQQRDAATLRHRYRPRHNPWLDLQTTLYATDSAIDLYGLNPTGSARGGTWLTRSKGLDVRNTLVLSGERMAHHLTLGVDHFDDEGVSESPSDPRLTERARNSGLYAQNRLDAGPWRLSAGLRHDRYTTRYANGYRTAGERTSPNLSIDGDVMQLAGSPLVAFAGVGQSVRGGKLNQAAWLTKYFLPPRYTVARPFTLGQDGVLKPEVGTQKQWGLRWQGSGVWTPQDHAAAELAFFNTRIRDYQVIPGEGVAGVTDRIFNAPAPITSRGVELRAHWGSPAWSLSAAYSHSVVRNYDGQPMDTTGDSARVGVSVGDRLSLDARWRASAQWQWGYTWVGVRRLKDVPAGRPEKPGYGVHGIQAIWQPSGKDDLVVTLGIDNIGDKRYAQHATTAIAVKGQTVANPEPGRSFKVAVDWRF